MTRVLTGIKPTGTPHLGNLVGAILPFIKKSQEEGVEPIIFIADLHALNSGISAESIQQSTKQIAATLLALGLDPEKVTFFRQSDIREVAVMKTLLENVTSKGLANKGHAYKAALNRNQAEGNDPDSGINMGLFTYPTLMAADILLYEAEQVPVGQDQKQHVEITRDIANAFNERARKNHSETQLILPRHC
jgi:tryptophanyl-tRNA synthetase